VTLNSFDFTLLGVPFTRGDIFQGGQVIFQDGVPQNVTASFQVFLPPGSPVTNITFGFGEPLGIAYIDLNGDFGSGSFSFQPSKKPLPHPSPSPSPSLALCTESCHERLQWAFWRYFGKMLPLVTV